MSAGEHEAVIEFTPKLVEVGIAAMSAVRFGFRKPLPETSIQDAARLAADGRLRHRLRRHATATGRRKGSTAGGWICPAGRMISIRAVAQANPKTIVLLQTGGPVLMPWLDQVGALLQAWFPGQEAGYAAGRRAAGAGRSRRPAAANLPRPRRGRPGTPRDSRTASIPEKADEVEYSEGLYIGYRHVDQAGLTPLFPFGFGLSYTSFELGEPQLSGDSLEPGGELTVTVPVRNTGDRAGQTVIQLYVRDPEARLERPSKELKGFAKVSLQPNETQNVTLTLDMRALAYFDDARAAWVADAGDFDLLIGTSSVDLPRTARVRLVREWTEPA